MQSSIGVQYDKSRKKSDDDDDVSGKKRSRHNSHNSADLKRHFEDYFESEEIGQSDEDR